MTPEQFMEEVRAQAEISPDPQVAEDSDVRITGRGVLSMEVNEGGDGVTITFYNVSSEFLANVERRHPDAAFALAQAPGALTNAVARDNRTVISVRGFKPGARRPGAKLARGKLRLSVLVWGGGERGFPRARTATPERVAAYAAKIVSQASELHLRLPRELQKDLVAAEWAKILLREGRAREGGTRNPPVGDDHDTQLNDVEGAEVFLAQARRLGRSDPDGAIDLATSAIRAVHGRRSYFTAAVGQRARQVDYAAEKFIREIYKECLGQQEENPMSKKPKRRAKLQAIGPNEIIVFVRTPSGPERKVVEVAAVEGPLAVHPSLRSLHEIERGTRRKPTEWGITHTPSGQLVATVGPKDWARRLAKEIAAFSDPGIESADPNTAAQAIGGRGLLRTRYILHVARQSREPKSSRGKFPTYKKWRADVFERGSLDENPADLASQAAVAAAVGSLVGGIIGAFGGAVLLGVSGAAIGAASAGTSGAATGAVVGGIYGVPLGSYIGTIWGAVRQTDRALEGHDATPARVLAGLGAALTGPLAPVGAGVGAYLGAPKG